MKSFFEDQQTDTGSLDAVRIVEFAAQASQLWLEKRPYHQPQKKHAEGTGESFRRAAKLYRIQLKNAELIGELQISLSKKPQCQINEFVTEKISCALEGQIKILLLLIQTKTDLQLFQPELELILSGVRLLDAQQSVKETLPLLETTLNHLVRIHNIWGLMQDTTRVQKLDRYVTAMKSGMTKIDRISASWYRSGRRKDRAMADVLDCVLRFIVRQHHGLSKTISQLSRA